MGQEFMRIWAAKAVLSAGLPPPHDVFVAEHIMTLPLVEFDDIGREAPETGE